LLQLPQGTKKDVLGVKGKKKFQRKKRVVKATGTEGNQFAGWDSTNKAGGP